MAVSPLTHRNGPADPKIHRRTAKDPEEPKQSWKKGTKLETDTFHFQSLPQSYHSQDSVVLQSPEISLDIYRQLVFHKGDKVSE